MRGGFSSWKIYKFSIHRSAKKTGRQAVEAPTSIIDLFIIMAVAAAATAAAAQHRRRRGTGIIALAV